MRDGSTRQHEKTAPAPGYLGGKRITDIVVTHHARARWTDRVESGKTGFRNIAEFVRSKLKTGAIRTYYKHEEDVYVIDDDLVMVAELTPDEAAGFEPGQPPGYKLVVVTFLGRMSETMELRDLRSYYSWLRHSRRMTLIKNGRKRR